MGMSHENFKADRSIVAPANGQVNGTHDPHAEIHDVPVLIVGGGPAGLLQSYLLSCLGIQNLVIERYLERLAAPKAHALSPRSLEICRQFGLDTQHIRSLGTQRDDAYWVNFLTTLSGEVLGQLPYERMDPDVLDHTPEMIHNIPQPTFEHHLAGELSRRGDVEIRRGHSFVSFDQQKDVVTTTVEERATGNLYHIRSRFVIGCDGAKSKVRQCMGVETDGEDSYETMMTIHFSADLRAVVGKRVGMLHWLFDPLASGFIIAYDLSDNAVLITNFDSEKHPLKSWNDDLCRHVLNGAIGKDISPKILSFRPWVLSRRVANAYRSGSVFLAGDAAHSFPPTGGLGLNSGLADVHNLAFKIAAVSQGTANHSMLDSYEVDRRHVAVVNSSQSVKNGQKIFGFLKTLGTAGTTDIYQARRILLEALNDPQQKGKIEEGVGEQREHFDNLQLHIGYVYGDVQIPDNASQYIPRFIAGARLPHAWLRGSLPTEIPQLKPINLGYVTELSLSEVKEKRYSTLDLCAYDSWTIILGSAPCPLEKTAKTMACRFAHMKLNILTVGKDFQLLPGAASQRWLRDSGLENGRGILVRPDQHIFRMMDAVMDEDSTLQDLAQFLGIQEVNHDTENIMEKSEEQY